MKIALMRLTVPGGLHSRLPGLLSRVPLPRRSKP